MGLLDIFMPYKPATTGFGPNRPEQNGFTNWANQNPYTLQGLGTGLSALGAGMVGHGSDPRGMVTGINQALAAQQGPLGQLALNQKTYDAQQQEVAKQQQQQNQTVKWLQDKGQADLAAAVQNGMMSGNDAVKMALTPQTADAANDPASVAEYKFYANQEMQSGREPVSYSDWRKGANQTVRAGMGAPIWGKNRKTGEYMPFEPMSDGTISSLISKDANPADFIFDPGTVASDRAAGAAYGTAQGGQQYAIPKAALDIETELGNIDALVKNTEGLNQSFGNLGGVNIGGIGWPNQWSPTTPNTPKAGFQAQLAQVKGENFLAAYSQLRGAGAITEQEGQAAKEAMARLDTAQSKEDFLTALADLKAILVKGYKVMAQQTSGGAYQSNGFTPPPMAGQNFNTTSSGVKWTVN